jgi:hypothetical protein
LFIEDYFFVVMMMTPFLAFSPYFSMAGWSLHLHALDGLWVDRLQLLMVDDSAVHDYERIGNRPARMIRHWQRV